MRFPSSWLPCLLLLLAAGQPAIQAAHAQAAPLPTNRLPLDPAVRTGRLPNGLTYYIRQNATPAHEAKLVLANRVGSLLEEDDQRGLAHFLEHMAFNGTRDFPKHELVNTLQRAGVRFGADLNAYTTESETVYELPLSTSQPGLLRQGVRILANWAGHLTLDEQEMNQERGIILEEARQRGLNVAERVRRQQAPVLLNHARLTEREAIGLEHVIRTAPIARLRQFYQDWYRPDLQAVVAVGDFDPAQVEAYLKEYFGELRNPVPARPLPTYTVPTSLGTETLAVTDPELAVTKLTSVVRRPAVMPGTLNELQATIDHQLFAYTIGVRLGELSRQPQAPFLSASAGFGNLTTDTEAAGLSVSVAHPAAAPAAVAALLREVGRPLSSAEVDRAKAVMRASLEAHWQERDKTLSGSYADEYVQHFLHQAAAAAPSLTREAALRHLETVTPAQLSALATSFTYSANRVLLLEAPQADKAQLPPVAALATWFTPTVASLSMVETPRADSAALVAPLVSVPAGGRIVREKYRPAVGATELLLNNGVRVVLKPTALRNEEILFASYAYGGTSLASDADFTAASMSIPLVLASGVGAWPRARLNERLAGHNLSVAPAVGELTQGVQGSCSPAELETTLQLLYLYHAQPRHDSLAWNALRSRALANLATRSLEPSRVLLDTLASVLGGGSFRRLAPTSGRVQGASQAVAKTFYQARFGNAADFTFVLVGNLDSATVRPLLARYLGALPTRPGRPAEFRNLRLLPPAGPLTKVLRRGHEDKATVQLIFQGPLAYSPRHTLALKILEDLLELRLLERLREQEGGVYSPTVATSSSKLPSGRYNLTISFSCAPASVDKLIAATLEEAHKLASQGPLADDFARVLAQQRTDLARQGNTNSYWRGYLMGQYLNQEPLVAPLYQSRHLAAFTLADARRAARRYLNPQQLLRFKLLPE